MGVAVDSNGLYFSENWISDEQDSTVVRRVRWSDLNMKIYAGSLREVNDNGTALAGRLRLPRSIAAASGNVIIADTGTRRVRKVSGSGAITTLYDGGGSCGSGYARYPDFFESGLLSYPAGVAVDATNGDVYVADSTGAGKVARIDDPTTLTTVVSGLNGPYAIAMDANKHLYIAESWNHCIRMADVSGNPPYSMTTVAGVCGQYGSTPETGSAVLTPLYNPLGVAVNAAGTEIYIADTSNNRIRKVVGGTMSTLANASDGVSAPSAIAIDASGNVYYADGTYRVRKIATSGAITTLAGLPPTARFGFYGDGGPGEQASLNINSNGSTGLAVSGSAVYFSDTYNNRIRKVSSDATSNCTFTVSPLSVSLPMSGMGFAIVGVTTQTGCGWLWTANDAWIHGLTIFGMVHITADATLVPRGGSITVAGQVVTVSQGLGTACTYSLPPGPYTYGGDGGTGSLVVNTSPGCQWTAATAPWITITSGASGSGPGTIQYTVTGNQTCAARNTTIALGSGVQSNITQSAIRPYLGVFRDGWWYVDANRNGQWDGSSVDLQAGHFGTAGDYPFHRNWSVDSSSTANQTKQAVFRSGPAVWFFDRDASGSWTIPDDPSLQLMPGQTGDQPVVGDWAGVGKSSIGIFRAGQWYLDKSGNGAYGGAAADLFIDAFGTTGDQPVAGNWDNSISGVRIGVFRPSTGYWYLRQNALSSNSTSTFLTMPSFGTTGDIAVTGDWNGDGKSKIGVFRNGTWLLDCHGTGLIANALTAQFGQAGDRPFVADLKPIVTPYVDPFPHAGDVTPAVSKGSSQLLTASFDAPGGYQTLDVVNVLINNVLDGRHACYLAYSRPANALYIVADNGDSTKISGKVMDGKGTVGNSQCTVNLAGSSAMGEGNTLTLVLDLSFTASFAGNKVVYTAARDLSQNNSGWQTVGVHGVTPMPVTYPNPVGMDPSHGETSTQTITFTYQDQATASNLQTVWALINTAIDGRAACYVAYYRPGNQLYLYPDNGDGAQATNIVLTGSNTISNSQCTVSAQGANVQSSGNTLTVTLPITFKTAFAGYKGVWLAAQTMGGAQTSLWQALGAVEVPAQSGGGLTP